MPSSKEALITKRRKERLPKMMYAAFHETNIALCLAGGFLNIRIEASASKDHHFKSGGVVFSNAPVPSKFIVGAQGDIDYGLVCLAEVEIDDFSKEASESYISEPVQITKIKRLLFSSDENAKTFQAHLSAYSDVPLNFIEITSDPKKFPKPDDFATPIEVENFASDDITKSVSQDLDKLAGAIASVISMYRNIDASLMPSFADTFTIKAGQEFFSHLVDEVIRGDDSSPADISLKYLALEVASILQSSSIKDGFNPLEFISTLEKNLKVNHPNNFSESIQTFLDRSRKVINAQVELKDDAFLDAPEKTIPRAILLFLLNPEWERLCIAQSHLKKIGTKVKILSAYFSGIYSGLTNLPVTCKANTKESFFGLIEMAYCLHQKSEIFIELNTRWSSNGNGEKVFRFKGYPLIKMPFKAEDIFTDFYRIASESSYQPLFDSLTGQLSFRLTHSSEIFLVSKSLTPYFPREECLIFSINIDRQYSRKELEQNIYPLMNKCINSGVFFLEQTQEKGKRIMLQLFVFCKQKDLSRQTIETATQALTKIKSEFSLSGIKQG